jgi:hypothetical protein
MGRDADGEYEVSALALRDACRLAHGRVHRNHHWIGAPNEVTDCSEVQRRGNLSSQVPFLLWPAWQLGALRDVRHSRVLGQRIEHHHRLARRRPWNRTRHGPWLRHVASPARCWKLAAIPTALLGNSGSGADIGLVAEVQARQAFLPRDADEHE